MNIRLLAQWSNKLIYCWNVSAQPNILWMSPMMRGDMNIINKVINFDKICVFVKSQRFVGSSLCVLLFHSHIAVLNFLGYYSINQELHQQIKLLEPKFHAQLDPIYKTKSSTALFSRCSSCVLICSKLPWLSQWNFHLAQTFNICKYWCTNFFEFVTKMAFEPRNESHYYHLLRCKSMI